MANKAPSFFLASLIHSISFENMESSVIEAAKSCVLDYLGSAFAGSQKKEAYIFKEYFLSKYSIPESKLFQNFDCCISYQYAAALNGIYGHMLDIDDVHSASITHLGVVSIPTALALGQKIHCSGKKLIESIVSGYEAGARIGEALNPSSYRFWHTTGIVGPFSSGAVSSKLLDLSDKQILNCFGTSGTLSAGLWQFLENGSMSKLVHVAHSNLIGLMAAEMAQAGVTGSDSILEGKKGILQALSGSVKTAAITEPLDIFKINQISFKKFACCRHIHSAITALMDLLEEDGFCVDEISEITDETYSVAFNTVNNPHPLNAYAAKFSIQFCIAAYIMAKNLNPNVFSDSNLSSEDIADLMKKISVVQSDDLDKLFKETKDRWPHRLTVSLKNGKKLIRQADYPIGDPHNPFSKKDEENKFLELTKNVIGKERAKDILENIRHLESINDINDIFR